MIEKVVAELAADNILTKVKHHTMGGCDGSGYDGGVAVNGGDVLDLNVFLTS